MHFCKGTQGRFNYFYRADQSVILCHILIVLFTTSWNTVFEKVAFTILEEWYTTIVLYFLLPAAVTKLKKRHVFLVVFHSLFTVSCKRLSR